MEELFLDCAWGRTAFDDADGPVAPAVPSLDKGEVAIEDGVEAITENGDWLLCFERCDSCLRSWPWFGPAAATSSPSETEVKAVVVVVDCSVGFILGGAVEILSRSVPIALAESPRFSVEDATMEA